MASNLKESLVPRHTLIHDVTHFSNPTDQVYKPASDRKEGRSPGRMACITAYCGSSAVWGWRWRSQMRCSWLVLGKASISHWVFQLEVTPQGLLEATACHMNRKSVPQWPTTYGERHPWSGRVQSLAWDAWWGSPPSVQNRWREKVTVEHKGTEACQAEPAPVGLETHWRGSCLVLFPVSYHLSHCVQMWETYCFVEG